MTKETAPTSKQLAKGIEEFFEVVTFDELPPAEEYFAETEDWEKRGDE